MVEFWLDNPVYLLNTKNFTSSTTKTDKYIKLLNITALISLIVGLVMVFRKKKAIYFGISIIVMSMTILVKSNITTTGVVTPASKFTNISNAFDTGIYLVKSATGKDPSGLNNVLYVNDTFNLSQGDIIALSNNNSILETNIISDIKYTTTEPSTPVIILLKDLKGSYSKYTTKILKVSDSTPDIITGPDGNLSIQLAGNPSTTDPLQMATQNYPAFKLPNQNRFDWNLENSTMVPGGGDTYNYQGQPFGPLKCRTSTVLNPMGTINVTEFGNSPTMYGTCNVAELTDGKLNDYVMTSNQEATVPQSVNDLLFHKGNSQYMFSPVPGDTIPDNQEAFANFCYRSPSNLINPKYASIFVNDPEKYKLVSKLAQATGTENGGGGGGGGRP